MATATRKKKKRSSSDDEDLAPRRKKRGSSGGGGTVKLDLRKTERGKKGGHRYPEGEYKIEINKAERKTAQSGNTQIVMHCTILEPEKYAGKPLIDRVTLTEQAMFRVGWLLDAIGVKWANAVVNFPLKKLAGQVIGVQLYDDSYQNKISSKVAEYYTEEEIDDFLADEDDDDEDEDDDDLEDDDEEDEDEDDEELDLDEDDEDEDDDEEDDEFDEMNTKQLLRALKREGIKKKKSWDDDDMREALREAEDDEDDDEDDL